MTDRKTMTLRCGALILLCASALFAGDDDIASFAASEPLAPGREILAEPVEGTLFQAAVPADAGKGLLLFRRKNADGGYELFAGRHVAATVEGLSAFPLGGMTPEKALKTRFYRKLRQPKFQDEPLVYVDSERIYCSGLSKLYYLDGSEWKEIAAEPVGAIEVREIDDSVLRTAVCRPGWGSVRLVSESKSARLVGAPVLSGQVTRRQVHLGDRAPLDTSIVGKNQYADVAKRPDHELEPLADSVKAELALLQGRLAKLKVEYDAQYGAVSKMDAKSIPMGDTAGYNAYVREFETLRAEDFGAWTKPYAARIELLEQRQKEIRAALDSLDGKVYPKPVFALDHQATAIDSAKGIWALQMKVTSSDSLVRGTWKGVLTIAPAEAAAFFAELEAHKAAASAADRKPAPAAAPAPAPEPKPAPAPEKGKKEKGAKAKAAEPAEPAPVPPAPAWPSASAVQWTVSYQGRTVATPIGPRLYRIVGFGGTMDGKPLALDGEFTLPEKIRKLSPVKAWLDERDRAGLKDRLESERQRVDSVAMARRAGDSLADLDAERYAKALALLRGRVAEIPGGTFFYKGTSVEMSSFAIGATEITQEHWDRFFGVPSRSRFKGPQKPVTNVTWTQARDFCVEIGGDLPTEAQWEYAARAGTTTYFFWGDRKNVMAKSYAVYAENSKKMPRKSPHYGPWKVGSLHPNPWGVFDMAGNVTEWVKDYRTTVRLKIETKDPQGPQSDMINHYRVLKGGSWADSKKDLQHEKYDWDDPRYSSDRIGFRCAFPPNQEPTMEEIEKRLRVHVGDSVEVFPPELRPAKPDSAKVDSAKAVPAKADSAKVAPAAKPAKADSAKAAPAAPAKADSAKTAPAAKPEPKADSAKTASAVKPEPAKADSAKVAPAAAPKQEAKPAAAPAAAPAKAKPEAKPETKPAAKAEAKPETKAEPAKAETKPAAKPETKPAEKKAK